MSSGEFERKPVGSTMVQDAIQRRDTSVVPGKRSLTEQLSREPQTSAVQRKAIAPSGDTSQAVHTAAEQGIAGSSTRLPFANQIQRAFGHHDISGIQAHTDGAAAASAGAMGAGIRDRRTVSTARRPRPCRPRRSDVRLSALLFLFTASCHPMTTPPSPKTGLSPDDQVTTAADRDHKSGTVVEAFGTYVLTEDKDQGTSTGHAAVQLADGTLIHLAPPWHQEAIRPQEELKLAGQPVVAKGLLFAECPPPPDGRAYARVACLHLGLKVLERSTYDFLHGRDPEQEGTR